MQNPHVPMVSKRVSPHFPMVSQHLSVPMGSFYDPIQSPPGGEKTVMESIGKCGFFMGSNQWVTIS